MATDPSVSLHIENRIAPRQALLGCVAAQGLRTQLFPTTFGQELDQLLTARRQPLNPEEDALREAVRNLLRNGRYRPTGRGKPASEYLLRSALDQEGPGFPRINAPVDVCNYISLKYLLPISLWDVDLAGVLHFRFRTGKAGESYVFNAGGQIIEVEDLISGFRVEGTTEEPVVNPVKDSMRTKTTDASTFVAAVVYAPADAIERERMAGICREFADLLRECGPEVVAGFDLAGPGEDCIITL